MASYDTQAQQIKRQQMIADALRASGNEGVQYAAPSGNRAYKHSPLEGLNKVLQQLTGAYLSNRADKDKAALDQQDQANLSQLIDATKSPEGQGYIRPITDVAGVPNAPAIAQDQQLDADRKANLQAAALRGVQFGGTAAPLAGELLQREALPKEPEYLTAADGSNIYQVDKGTGTAKLLVSNQKDLRESPEDRQLVNIVDPSAKSGFRTIKRADWNGEQLYERPPASSNLGDLTDKQEAEADKLAKMVYEYRIAPLPLGTRNPLNAVVMAKVSDMATANGEEYSGAEFPARSKALNAFSGGKQGQTVRSFNVLLDHVDTLKEAAMALQNSDVKGLNSLKNWFKDQFGSGVPATLDALKNIVRGEVVKAITASGGAESDRQEALAAISGASTPAGVIGPLEGIKTLAVGQLAGLQREFTSTTGLSDKRFQSYLSPKALALMGVGDTSVVPATGPQAPGPKTPPVKVATPEEARALPPGTHFVTPDGHEYTR